MSTEKYLSDLAKLEVALEKAQKISDELGASSPLVGVSFIDLIKCVADCAAEVIEGDGTNPVPLCSGCAYGAHAGSEPDFLWRDAHVGETCGADDHSAEDGAA